MKYWPLTAVLLAFWLGRETGADEKPAPKDAEFGVIRCNRIEVRDPKTPGATTEILADRLRVSDETSAAAMSPGAVGVGAGAGANQKYAFNALMDARDDHASVTATSADSGYESSLVALNESAHVTAWNRKEVRAKTNQGSARLSASPDERRFVVSDKKGTERAVLGTAEVVNKKPGAELKYSESTLTLYDAKGNVLEQLPR